MDLSPGSSSHHKYDSKRRNGESRHRRKHHRTSKSRSRSPIDQPRRAYINPSPKFNFFNGGCTQSEYEVKIQALTTQLTIAQSQITGLDAQVHSHRTRCAQLEHQLYVVQQENHVLASRNAEILSVMTALEAGVETLQREKDALVAQCEDLRAKWSGFEKEKTGLSEQIVYLEKRNATLSKKCVEILESGKANKERLEKTEAELNNVKSQSESQEVKYKEMEEQHKNTTTRISTFETREKLWINEKLAIEQRVKDLLAAEKRLQEEVKQLRLKEIAASIRQNCVNTVNSSANFDAGGIESEHLKALHFAVESLQAHHETELKRTRLKLESLTNR